MSSLYNPHQTDDRSFKQQMSDLGVEVIKPDNSVTGIKWAKKHAVSNRGTPAIRIGERSIYINVTATEMLAPRGKRYAFGTGNYRGQKVILIRESATGYRLTITVNKGCVYATSTAAGLLRQLAEAGIKPGRYKLDAINGGWMGVPE